MKTAEMSYPEKLPRAKADIIRRRWTPVDAVHRNLRKLCIPVYLERADCELGRVIGEDVVAIFRRCMAGKAGFVERLVAGLSVLKVSETPAA